MESSWAASSVSALVDLPVSHDQYPSTLRLQPNSLLLSPPLSTHNATTKRTEAGPSRQQARGRHEILQLLHHRQHDPSQQPAATSSAITSLEHECAPSECTGQQGWSSCRAGGRGGAEACHAGTKQSYSLEQEPEATSGGNGWATI